MIVERRMSRTLSIAWQALLIGTIAYLLFRPGGGARVRIERWRAQRAFRTAVDSLWPTISGDALTIHGDPRLAVSLVEFGDFQCPYCREAVPVLDSLIATHPRLHVAFVNLPLPMHRYARDAAIAGICASEQGRFARIYHYLYETESWDRDPNWATTARAVGVDNLRQFRRCLRDAGTARRVDREIMLAKALALHATPTFVSQRDVVVGVPTEHQLETLAPTMH